MSKVIRALTRDELKARVVELEAAHEAAMKVVNEQADDKALWGNAVYASEAYIQQELRRLAAVVEGPPTKGT